MNSIDGSISRGYEYTWWFSSGILIKSCTIFVKDNKKSFSMSSFKSFTNITSYLTYFVQVNENDNFYILPNIISYYILHLIQQSCYIWEWLGRICMYTYTF